MSENIENKGNSKPITGAFELETKIRVIVQDVMAATIRKVSQFNEKIETFDNFFFAYKQRIQEIQQQSKNNEQQNLKIVQTISKNKVALEADSLRLQQMIEKMKIEKNEQDVSIKDMSKKLTTFSRQSQNIGNELSKTKSKFLDIQDQMRALKEDVAWKITKYIEETADANTKIKLTSQEIKKQYFNVCLQLKKNKQKYQEIISHQDHQENFNKQVRQDMKKLSESIEDEKMKVKILNTKLQEMDTALYSKIKLTQSKLERKIEDLEEYNKVMRNSVAKLETFQATLDQVKEDGQKIRRQLLKKFDESAQKHRDLLEQQILKINKDILAYEKTTDKKLKYLNNSVDKNAEFLTQKVEFLKVQIETEISSKTVKMLEKQKSQSSGVSNSMVEQITDRINKLSLQTLKNVNKLQNLIKEIKTDIKNQIQQSKDIMEEKVSQSMKVVQQSIKGGIDPEILQSIHEKMQNISNNVETKLSQMHQQIDVQKSKVLEVQTMKKDTQKQFAQLKNKSIENFGDLQEKLGHKVEKVMFTVTKMRGDAIIKNQFVEKEIKQLKKITVKESNQINSINKLIPAFGQCINLVMCLIFDAEYQHSRIIQDNLGGETNQVKFQNLLEGILYEYNDKKKPGNIYYRHKQYKKTDIVKNTFNAFIQLWEGLFENEYQNKSHMIPKTFYKNYVEKNIGRNSRNSPRKQGIKIIGNSKQYVSNKQLNNFRGNGNPGQSSRHSLGVGLSPQQSQSQQMSNNRSFHIRKKKNNMIKSKDEIVVIVSEEAIDKNPNGQ